MLKFSSSTFARLASSLFLLGAVGGLAQGIPDPLPGTWTYHGCYTDSIPRTLAAVTVVSANMTIQQCLGICDAADYVFAGVEYGQECYCDASLQVPGQAAEETDCSMPCAGDEEQLCGGSSRIGIFKSTRLQPEFHYSVEDVESETNWGYYGCWTDPVTPRTLSVGITVPGGVTPFSCVAACAASTLGPFTYAGVEDRDECFCGTELSEEAIGKDRDECRGACTADHDHYCGNPHRIIVYKLDDSE